MLKLLLGGIGAFDSPHHGGRSANPPWLYSWAKPGAVVVSQRMTAPGASDALTPLERRAIPFLRTWQQGVIRVEWSPRRITPGASWTNIDTRDREP